MLKTALASGLMALLLGAPAFAAPKVVSLGTDSTGDSDPIATCGAYAASPYEEGWRDRGAADRQIFLDGAQAACEAALNASPDSLEAKTWLARVYVLVGRAADAAPLLEDAAAAGNGFAQYLLAGLLDNGIDDGVEDDAGRALELLKQSAEAGFIPALDDLAERYETGTGADTDWSEAVRLYQFAAGKGDAHAIYRLGVMYQGGNGVDQDYARALELYQQAAEAGEPLGYDGIGQLYQFGTGVAQDYDKAAEAYRQGADAGEPQSEAALAFLYDQGFGVTPDYDKSFALLTDSANQGYGFGEAALGIHYLFGQGVASNPAKALELVLSAAAKKVNYANGVIGYIYAEGLGVSRDLTTAESYFQIGSDGGDQYSTDRLAVTRLEFACQDAAGSQYENGGTGHGLDFEAIDAASAIEACTAALAANPTSIGDQAWLARADLRAERFVDALPLLQAAADANNVLAQTLKADMLVGGQGVERDTAAAVELYRKAAEAGFPLAAFTLGRLYAEGDMVSADPAEALRWYRQAFAGGVAEAEARIAELTSTGGPGQPDLAALDTGFGREGPAY